MINQYMNLAVLGNVSMKGIEYMTYSAVNLGAIWAALCSVFCWSRSGKGSQRAGGEGSKDKGYEAHVDGFS